MKDYGNVPHELAIFFRGISWSVFSAAFLFAGYSALEPYCRKRMPELMVSWKRLLSGKFNDPRVGRDILFGLTNSVYVMISWCLIAALWPQAEIFENFQLLSGGRQILLHLGPDRTASLSYCFVCFLVFVGVASLTRSRTMAIVTSAVSSGLLQGTICQLPLTSWGLMVLSFVPVAIGLSRFGLLFYVTGAVGAALLGFPVTTNADAFYFQTGLVGPLIFGLLVIFTAATSCGRSLSTFLIPEPRSSKSS
ncbi:MAG: hypothetical protein KDB23_29470 [Planctomycetales bacterium]|nr:hypothetical protein [Planctomycetales bacterium]